MANKDVVFQYYGLFAEGKFDQMKAECFHPDVTWTMPGHHPLSGVMQGADACIAFLQALRMAGVWVEDVHVGELDEGTISEKHMGHAKYDDGRVVISRPPRPTASRTARFSTYTCIPATSTRWTPTSGGSSRSRASRLVWLDIRFKG